MPAFADLTLPDNAGVDQTFKPNRIDSNGVASWMTVTEASLDARRTVTSSVSMPKNGSPVARVKQRVTIPVMDPVDTSKKIADAYVNVEFVLPKLASGTVRLDLRKFADKLIESAVTTAAIDNFESVY